MTINLDFSRFSTVVSRVTKLLHSSQLSQSEGTAVLLMVAGTSIGSLCADDAAFKERLEAARELLESAARTRRMQPDSQSYDNVEVQP